MENRGSHTAHTSALGRDLLEPKEDICVGPVVVMVKFADAPALPGVTDVGERVHTGAGVPPPCTAQVSVTGLSNESPSGSTITISFTPCPACTLPSAP